MKSKFFLAIAVSAVAVLCMGAVQWTTNNGTLTYVGGVTNLVSEPSIVTTTSNAIAMTAATAPGGTEGFRLRLLQNVGTVPVLYRLGGTASASSYHGVLAPGTATRDGLGSQVDLTQWRGSVSIAVESGTGAVATVQVIR